MTFDKHHPFLAILREREVLNHSSSQKCTVHLSLDISGSHFNYQVGDSIGVYPENSPTIVLATLKALKADPDGLIIDPRSQESMTIRHFLTFKTNLSKVTKKWIEWTLEHSSSAQKEKLQKLMDPLYKEELKIFCEERQLWDFFHEYYQGDVPFHHLLPLFSPLLPRFYSIASSACVHPNKIDLLVAYFKYHTHHHLRLGVASHYLCEMAPLNTPSIPIFLHPSRGFTLPKDSQTPIIMIGPGTGVAPYRGFMQQRAWQQSSKNWLFFGEWNQAYDFYYQPFWEQLVQKGQLKLSLAFSRDQNQKIYVQHRMLENADLLWKWIDEGAVVYVCGDAHRMAKDVDQTLQDIIQHQGRKDSESARAYLKQMREESRYLRDVY